MTPSPLAPDPETVKPTRQQAIAAGLMFYHGRPCKHCGGTKRYAKSGKCPCWSRRRYALQWSVDNPNRASVLEKQRKRVNHYYHKNLEKQRAYQRQWHNENVDREKANARQRAARKTDPERFRVYTKRRYEKNREAFFANNALRKTRWKAATPAWLKESGQHAAIIDLYKQAKLLGMHVDHDIPIAGCKLCGAMGLHVLANLRLMDPNINHRKRNRCGDCFNSLGRSG